MVGRGFARREGTSRLVLTPYIATLSAAQLDTPLAELVQHTDSKRTKLEATLSALVDHHLLQHDGHQITYASQARLLARLHIILLGGLEDLFRLLKANQEIPTYLPWGAAIGFYGSQQLPELESAVLSHVESLPVAGRAILRKLCENAFTTGRSQIAALAESGGISLAAATTITEQQSPDWRFIEIVEIAGTAGIEQHLVFDASAFAGNPRSL